LSALREVGLSGSGPQLPVNVARRFEFSTRRALAAQPKTRLSLIPLAQNAAVRRGVTRTRWIHLSIRHGTTSGNCDPHNKTAPFDRSTVDYWMPVDQYIGGIEHAVLHLIYTRLWTKIMRDLGLVAFDEPVTRLLTQGMVCLTSYRCVEHDYLSREEIVDGKCRYCGRQVIVGRIEKMSKSKKNTIDPDEMIKLFGADTVRLVTLSDVPPEKDLEWSDAGAEGASRFLNRVWRIVYKWRGPVAGIEGEPIEISAEARALRRKTHQTIKRVSHDVGERMNFNTAIAALHELTNEIFAFDGSLKGAPGNSDLFALKEALEALTKLMAPLTPHLAEELWAALWAR
jgi:leucyl-tRNA synthetase